MAKWEIDTAHSDISFQVKHMMITNVKGHFDSYRAKIEAQQMDDLTDANIYIEIDVASIQSKNKERDDHLRSAEFFHADKYPKITFQSTNIEYIGSQYKIVGDLTIRDVTKQAVFTVLYNGKTVNNWGIEVYGFEGESVIQRNEFGLTWNATLEAGGVLVSNDIKICLNLELFNDK